MDQLRRLAFSNVRAIRISDTFSQPNMAADLFEHDLSKLNLLKQRGRESFGAREAEITSLFQDN